AEDGIRDFHVTGVQTCALPISGDLSFGILYAFINYLQQLFRPINDLTEKYNIMQSAMASAERIFELLDNQEAIPDPVHPKHVRRSEERRVGKRLQDTVKGEIG